MRAILLVAALALPACLAPQPLVPADDDTGLNDPPRILGRSPEPAIVRTQRGCGKQRLELLAVEDMDEQDAIEIRWFVNYHKGNTEPVKVSRREAEGFQDGIRTPPGDFHDVFFSQFEDQVLVVEAVVSDGFDAAPDAEPAKRAPARGKALAQTSWTVFVEGVQECLP
ncbi:MAG TPA: hypothetical protein VGD74_02000 [Vulgatibacter sp.]